MTENETVYELTRIRDTHLEIERQSIEGPLSRHVLPSIDAFQQVLLDCHGFAVDCRRRDEHVAIMEAYASVSAVAYCNAESARIALVRGFYGNAYALARALAMANDVVIDLMKTNESAEKWLALRAFKPGKGGNEAKRLRKYFQDGTLRARVRDLGEYSPSSDLYGILSDPVHTSPWSTAMYSSELMDEPGGYYLQYIPQYHPFRALTCGGLIAMTLPHLTGYFLEWCETHYEDDQRFRRLAIRHSDAIAEYDKGAFIHRKVLEQFDAANQRLREGEAFEEVFG